MSQLIKVTVGDMQIWMEPDQAAVTEAGFKKVSADGVRQRFVHFGVIRNFWPDAPP